MRIRHTALAIGLLGLAISGCTTPSEGQPISVPTSKVDPTDSSSPSSGNSDDLPSNGAPEVDHPLNNTSKFEQDPCSILTAEQTDVLGVPANGKEEEDLLGLHCRWFNEETGGQATIGFETKTGRGISGAYAANERGEAAYFKPLPAIMGYPAVASDATDRRQEGFCLVDVGVTDQLAYHVDVQLSRVKVGTNDPCDAAARVAEMALQTMKGA